MSPPAVAALLIEAVCPDADTRDGVLGDLHEEHLARCASMGGRRATWWYWRQTMRSTFPLAGTSLRHALPATLGLVVLAVVAGYAALAVMVVLTGAALDQVASMVGGATMVQTAFASLALALGCGVGAGYVAALIGRRAPLTSALALGVACSVLGVVLLLAANDSGTPVWYQASLAVVVLPSTFCGGVLRVRRADRRQ